MKKLIITCLGVLGLANSSCVYALDDTRYASVQFNFSVEVLQKNCKVAISPVDGTNNVDVGTLFKQVGSVGPIVPLKFRFSDCKGADAIESISYSRDMNGQGHVENMPYVSTLMDSKPSSVRIYLYKDAMATLPFTPINFGTSGQKITNEWVDICYIQAKIPNNQTLPDAGVFTGQALFTITYL